MPTPGQQVDDRWFPPSINAQQLAAKLEARAAAQPAGQADIAALRDEIAQLRDMVQQLIDALVPRADGMVVGVTAQCELLALLKEQEARRGRQQQAGSAS